MPNVIDYNAIAASVYQTVLGLNTVATSLVGLDCIWCRLLPYDNGEDVIVQEYTLHQYDCPKQLKVITSNTDYQIGNYMVDLWGVHSEVPLEINIDIQTWQSIFGSGTMPQKGDFVLFSLMHKAFEVKSSSIVYTVGEQPTSYKCQLGTWQHNANRKETEEFTQSINEITDSQDRLFGDVISKEVADAVIETETTYTNTTYKDSIKEFDHESVIIETLYGENGNSFSEAHYDFNKMSSNLVYQVAAVYDKSVIENHWIYSCWFKIENETCVRSGKVTIDEGTLIKEKDYWWFDITSEIPIEIGEEVTICRGSIIKLNGVIETRECEPGYKIRIPSSDCFNASSKVSSWWKYGNWKIQKGSNYNILTAYKGDDPSFTINLDDHHLIININGKSKKIVVSSKSANYSNWNYLLLDMSPSTTKVVIIKQNINTATNEYSKDIIVDKTVKYKIDNFEFDQMQIENAGNNIQMCNIRLYENEYPIEDRYLIDMYSNVTRNVSKCILVDGPLPVNNMSFISPLK